jgi:predicted MFS family arabinose efflux permease
LINVTFTLPKERAKAFGVYGAIAGGGAAIGLILGGTLTQYASWRWCLGVNVPIALVAVAMALPWLHESHAEGENSYDIPGAITVSLGLLSLVYGLSEAATKGWAKSSTYQFFIFAAILLALFFVIESRVKHPLLPVRVLAERNRGGSYLATLLIGSGLFTMFLFLSIYFQNVLGYSALKSGFAFLPFSMGVITFAGVASTLLPKIGARPLMLTGLLMATIGLFYLSRFTPHSSYLTAILPALLIMSTGLALVFIPSATTGLHGIGGRDSGVASAMINTSQQIGGSLGAALLNTVAVTASSAYATSHTSLGKALPGFAAVHGFSVAFRFGAIFLAIAAIIIALTINVGKHAAESVEGVALH